MDINWPEEFENIFGAVIKIAHYTHFSKNEILEWTIDEINKALKHIEKDEQKQAQLLFAVADYKILLDTVPTDDKGKVKSSERDDILEKANVLRGHFTGEKPETNVKINNLDFITKNGYNVVGTMSQEEYAEAKKQYNQTRKLIKEQYGT